MGESGVPVKKTSYLVSLKRKRANEFAAVKD